MEYSKKDIVSAKVGDFIGFLVTAGITAYFGLAYLDIVDISWISDLIKFDLSSPERKLPVLFIAGLAFLIFAIVFFSDLAASSKIKKSLAQFSEDEIIAQMNDSSTYVFEYQRKPYFFVTPKYLICKNGFICKNEDVSWTYLQHYKQSNFFIIKLRNNKELNAGGAIAAAGKSKEVITAMQNVIPGLLDGFTKENKEAHKERVKLAKGS